MKLSPSAAAAEHAHSARLSAEHAHHARLSAEHAFTLSILALFICACSSEHDTPRDTTAPAAHAEKSNASTRGPQGQPLVHIDKEAREHIALEIQGLTARSLQPEHIAYGRVVDDPAASFIVRAPIAGIWRAGEKDVQPAIGLRVQTGAALGRIEPRLTAVERADVAARIAAARGDAETAHAALVASRAELERTRKLNAENKNASDRALQEAEARVAGDQARVNAAEDTGRTLEALLAPGADSKASLPLALTGSGEIVELMAHPGEAVESGAPLVRVEDLERVLVRIDLPFDARIGADVARARISPATREDISLSGERVAFGAQVERDVQSKSVLFRVMLGEKSAPIGLRPGEAVLAWLPEPGEALSGFVVPRAAVVRLAGKAWVYRESGEEEFAREEIALDHPLGEGWFTSAAWAKAARIVVAGAQSLLSEEMLSSQKSGAGAEEE